MLTTFGSPSTLRWDARSATNSSSRCAAAIIARCTDPPTKLHGGARSELTPFAPPGRFGSKHIRFGQLLKPQPLISRSPREHRTLAQPLLLGSPSACEIANQS